MHVNLQELLNFPQNIGQNCKRQMKINTLLLQRMDLVNNFHVLEIMGENCLVLLILLLMCVRAETAGVDHPAGLQPKNIRQKERWTHKQRKTPLLYPH